jgi:CTP synthase
MEHQKGVTQLGATMRLGAYPCALKEGSLARSIYNAKEISERHRHRFEVNNFYRDQAEQKGLVFSGLSPDRTLVEMLEVAGHPWFIGVQFHPEFLSKPLAPHPLFSSFVKAAIAERERRNEGATSPKLVSIETAQTRSSKAS